MVEDVKHSIGIFKKKKHKEGNFFYCSGNSMNKYVNNL